jgi:hypothetical protein
MLWNKWWSVGHRATQAEWSLKSSWITAAAGWRVSGWGDEDTRVKAAFDASQKMDVQEARRQASSGEPAIINPPNPRNSQRPSTERRRGVGRRRRALQHTARSRHTIEASKQVEARHHRKQHIIPPTNMAASCIFCKIIKGTWKV